MKSPSRAAVNRDAKRFEETYTVDEVLTKTPGSIIYTGFDLINGNQVVLKQIPRKHIRNYILHNEEMIPAEIYYHFKAYENSKMIIQPLDWFERSSCYVLVLDKPDSSIDLYEFSKLYGAVNEHTAKIIWSQIVHCVYELYEAGIVHCDIKNENVLINPKTLEIKLFDFGCASPVRSDYGTCPGTPEFCPIEWYEENMCMPGPLNVWSLGAILYILLCNEWNFKNGIHFRNFKKELQLSSDAKSLIDSMFCSNPFKRISVDQIIKSSWLT